jgi:hypothetical protein
MNPENTQLKMVLTVTGRPVSGAGSSHAWRMCKLLLLALVAPLLHAQEIDGRTGRELMEEVYERHQQYPYIYEEQSMIMEDRSGGRDTRKLKRYTRIETDGTIRFLLIFDSPPEVKGVALLASRDPEGKTLKSLYLPAFAQQLIESSGNSSDGNLLGTDFSIEDLTNEILADYKYIRRPDTRIADKPYYLVEVYQADADPGIATAIRRHFIRQDNFYITRTDHYDRHGRLHKQQTFHDLKQINGDMWRASMILMVDLNSRHQSLIKIDRRVFSRDYVPPEIFTANWLFENYPPVNVREQEEIGDPEQDDVVLPLPELQDSADTTTGAVQNT